MKTNIPAFKIFRTYENAKEINDIANKFKNEAIDFTGYNSYIYFNGKHFYFNWFTFSIDHLEITLDQFREYFSVKKQYTLPDGDVVSEGDEVWYHDKDSFLIYSCYAFDNYIAFDDDTSECFSTREKCEQALNKYKLKLAAERYPKGTMFKTALNNFDWVSSGEFKIDTRSKYIGNIIGVFGGCIYDAFTNQWAEIVPSEDKQPIAYRFNDTNSEFEVIYNKSIQSIIIPTEIAIRAGFEPIYEVEKTPLEQAIALLKRTTEYDVLDEWKKKVTELEQLIKK